MAPRILCDSYDLTGEQCRAFMEDLAAQGVGVTIEQITRTYGPDRSSLREEIDNGELYIHGHGCGFSLHRVYGGASPRYRLQISPISIGPVSGPDPTAALLDALDALYGSTPDRLRIRQAVLRRAKLARTIMRVGCMLVALLSLTVSGAFVFLAIVGARALLHRP